MEVLNRAIESIMNSTDRDDWEPIVIHVTDNILSLWKGQVRLIPVLFHWFYLSCSTCSTCFIGSTCPVLHVLPVSLVLPVLLYLFHWFHLSCSTCPVLPVSSVLPVPLVLPVLFYLFHWFNLSLTGGRGAILGVSGAFPHLSGRRP